MPDFQHYKHEDARVMRELVYREATWAQIGHRCCEWGGAYHVPLSQVARRIDRHRSVSG